MWLIPLTQDKNAKVDDADFEFLNQWKWYFIKDGYAVRSDYSNVYISINGHRSPRQVKMHRLIMGEPEGLEVDHISGDKLDNRRSNIRVASKNQNQQNARVAKNNRSGFKGVSWNNQVKKWRACLQVQIDGRRKTVYLGHYDRPIDGARAYNLAASEYFGEFARLNHV